MKPVLRSISEQVVVLFGATSGIGLESALHFVEKGAKVALVGRSKEGLREAFEQVRMHATASKYAEGHANGGSHTSAAMDDAAAVASADEQILSLEADVTNFDEVRSVAQQVNEHFGRIDTWVNVVGVSEWALFEETTAEEFRRIIDVNLVGQAHGAMAALPYLKQQGGGSLIFVASMAGRVPIPYQAAYNASKHGLLGMIDTLRLEMKHTQVPVNITAILPASINTLLFNKARTKLGVEPQPVRPIYDAKFVAQAILYAAQHPVNELIVGDSGYVINFMKRVAPTATNNMMGVLGFRQQHSDEPKSALAADNLEHHMRGYNEVDGEFGHRTMQISPLTWLATHPRVRLGLLGLAITGLGFLLGSRIMHQRSMHHRTLSYRAGRLGGDISTLGHKAGAFVTALPLVSNLPWFRRRSTLQKIIAALPQIKSLRRRKTLAQRISLPHRQKSIHDRLPFREQRKGIAGALPRTDTFKDLAAKLPMVERRQTLVEKLPIGERYEAVIEKLPFRK